MAKSGAVWGIDIGNCALKALRCRRHEKDSNRVVVEAFDFVEYAKILTQPEADREALVREAIETFVSRNEVKGDRVAISVPGQSGLSRFIKLPPVEKKKIPDIVKYEARQQIPFALEDVVWDYQQLEGGSQEEDYALNPEVGLFAMKRDQVHRALRPLTEAGIEVDYIQLAPLAIYNFACFDRMNNLEDAPPFDPDNPPKSLLVLSFGTETTDLVVTNGFRVWQRNIPIGGSHFTRALTKELQLTFTKAEHLKRNATKAEDPKQLFQAMRPVFSDLVAEIQRSIGFFMNNNKNAEIGDIVALGNPMRLPGLQRYLSQNLDQKVLLLEAFPGLVGGSVTDAPQFKANHLSFAEAYGLCVQGLGLGRLNTNLLPEEIITERLVKGKKPWAVAAAAVLLIGMTGSYFSYYGAYASADVEKPEMERALSTAATQASTATTFETTHSGYTARFDEVAQIRNSLRSNDDGRLLWIELTKAIHAALPHDERSMAEKEQTAEDVMQRTELHIERVDCEYFPEVSVWYSEVKSALEEAAGISTPEPAAVEAAADAAGDEATADAADEERPDDEAEPEANALAAEDEEFAESDALAEEELVGDTLQDFAGEGLDGEGEEPGPTGDGWVIQLTGYHLHNNSRGVDAKVDVEGGQFVRETLIKSLQEGSVMLPDSEGKMVEISFKDLGISYPLMVSNLRPVTVRFDPNAATPEEATKAWQDYKSQMDPDGGARFGGLRRPKPAEEIKPPEQWTLRRYDFEVQFLWQPKPRSERGRPPTEVEAIDEFARAASPPAL